MQIPYLSLCLSLAPLLMPKHSMAKPTQKFRCSLRSNHILNYILYNSKWNNNKMIIHTVQYKILSSSSHHLYIFFYCIYIKIQLWMCQYVLLYSESAGWRKASTAQWAAFSWPEKAKHCHHTIKTSPHSSKQNYHGWVSMWLENTQG